MVTLHTLKKTVQKSAKRRGRGHGSGRGMKSGHGTTRHQNARESIPLFFEGGQGRMVKKYPLLRGKNKNNSVRSSIHITTGQLNTFDAGTTVSYQSLIEKNFLSPTQKSFRVKIVLRGDIEKKLTIALPVTANARIAIEKAGGTITVA
jgi:large subunit ribosomal protein L15